VAKVEENVREDVGHPSLLSAVDSESAEEPHPPSSLLLAADSGSAEEPHPPSSLLLAGNSGGAEEPHPPSSLLLAGGSGNAEEPHPPSSLPPSLVPALQPAESGVSCDQEGREEGELEDWESLPPPPSQVLITVRISGTEEELLVCVSPDDLVSEIASQVATELRVSPEILVLHDVNSIVLPSTASVSAVASEGTAFNIGKPGSYLMTATVILSLGSGRSTRMRGGKSPLSLSLVMMIVALAFSLLCIPAEASGATGPEGDGVSLATAINLVGAGNDSASLDLSSAGEVRSRSGRQVKLPGRYKQDIYSTRAKNKRRRGSDGGGVSGIHLNVQRTRASSAAPVTRSTTRTGRGDMLLREPER
jgi:hypothetical protein